MRYDPAHKAATRRRIVETAAARFRRDGIDPVGVAEIMAGAGLTHGGFYAHFASKDELVRDALEAAALGSRERFRLRIEEGGLESWIRFYLRETHRDHPEAGCVVAALAGEIARQPRSTRARLAASYRRLIATIAAHLPGAASAPAKRATAVALFALMTGAMQTARAVDDPGLSAEILAAATGAALALARGESARR